MKVYVESLTVKGLRWEVTEFDPETRIAQLLGPTGVPFMRRLTKEDLAKLGHKLVKEKDNAEQSGVQT